MKLSYALVLSLALFSCQKTDDGTEKDRNTESESEEKNDENAEDKKPKTVLTGKVAIDQATHAYIVAPDDFDVTVAKVVDSKFSADLDPSKPYSISIIDSQKSGVSMTVGRFATGTLDSVAISNDELSKTIDLGTLSVTTQLASDGVAILASNVAKTDLIEQMGLSEGAAKTLGEVDNTIARYSNPDIDGDGVVDSESGNSFPLDFHNRFTPIKDESTAYEFDDMINKFLPATTVFQYQSTGIIPEFDLSDYFDSTNTYSWTFSTQTVLHSNGCTSGLTSGDALAASTECIVNGADDQYGKKAAINVESVPPTGTYTLKIGTHTFQWPNIEFNDLASGKGFLALFIRYNVNTDNMLTSISYQYRIKTDSDTYELASQSSIDLIIKNNSSYLSLKIDGNSDDKSIGIPIPETPEGDVLLNTLTSKEVQGVDLSEVINGINIDRVKQNPGLSYDDKLGMRFFF